MWGRKRKAAEALAPEADAQGPLKAAVRKARIEIAEKSSVVVDLRDAGRARHREDRRRRSIFRRSRYGLCGQPLSAALARPPRAPMLRQPFASCPTWRAI